jgi:hypothetical protein
VTGHLTLRPELDQLRCEEPGCGHTDEIVLSPSCHPEYLTIASYRRGELALECAECGDVYLRVLVAG